MKCMGSVTEKILTKYASCEKIKNKKKMLKCIFAAKTAEQRFYLQKLEKVNCSTKNDTLYS